MYIHEAVGEALKAPSTLTRPNFPDGCFLLVVQNERYCLYLGTDGIASPIYGWEPSASDLIADDWEVTRAEGIEWPEEPQKPERRLWKRLAETWFPHK